MPAMTAETTGKKRGTDGSTLDVAWSESETLPHGLARLSSGALVVTRLYCPAGHDLTTTDKTSRFNGYPGITLMVRGARAEGQVVLSPIHGDDTKFGEMDFEPGEVTRISCPVCDAEFPVVQDCGCTEGAHLVGLFLDDSLTAGNQVVVCTAWGCVRSRVLDRFQIISKYE
jgi:hypothetical protein